MKLKVQHVMDATLVITQIIREKRPMPQKGKYRLARIHDKLLPEFNTASAQRDDLIKAYDFHQKIIEPGSLVVEGHAPVLIDGPEFTVPPDKMEEFTAAWAKIAEEEIEIAVEPIPLAQLDMGDGVVGAIEAGELIVLGDLVTE